MKKISLLIPVLFLFIISVSCKRDHFISDSAYRNKVEDRFNIQKELAKNRSDQLFKVFDENLLLKEKEALQFLYAFMPLSDLADYDGEFYLKNVRSSFAARDTFKWGKVVPEDIFRHFVLPIRVNNENLDTARWVFFTELKDRIKGLSMKDATLEVNHWCHEKVTYKGSDIRTSSPLATVKTAYGRCGEESTFTVAALRSVCIPARQCYTPRWAHCDDNHAWVEVWVDGQWHYIGACEPEPGLDMAWFTGPAKRAMLVNTNVFGDYEGKEDVLVKDVRFTRINVLPNYTETKRIHVKVLDIAEKPVDSATVEFLLYNYAEFYPLTKSLTDKNGFCSFLTGLGDILVWSSKGDHFGYEKVTVKNTDTVTIILSLQPGRDYSEDIDFVPPQEIKVESTVSDSLKKKNTERFAFENELRANYESTFTDSSKSYRLAGNLKMNGDTLWMILQKSRGNWREIINFITAAPEDQKRWIFPLLLSISEKDLRDVNPEVLTDNLSVFNSADPYIADIPVFSKFILSPRIDNEYLKAFKDYFRNKFDKIFIENSRKNPELLIEWIKANIRIDNDANYSRSPITPVGVYKLKVSDDHSRDIFFVAVCRSFGIPSRLETATRTPQYMKDGKWIDVAFAKQNKPGSEKGTLILENDKQNDRKPEYYIHFTVGKFTDGFYRSLDYEYDPVMSKFPSSLQVIPGAYLMVTGNRISGGTVLSKLNFFNVETGKTKMMTISLRKDILPLEILGKLNVKSFLNGMDLQQPVNIDPDKGMIIAWLDPLTEPTRHFVADLVLKKEEFNKWHGNILLFFPDEKGKADFILKNRAALPSFITYLVSNKGVFNHFINSISKPTGQRLPVVSFVNKKSEIIFFSEGYRIGSGDDLLRSIISE
jgi:transglutaminase-like putative cysteine protease